MSTDLQCYCCKESNLIVESVIGDAPIACVTELDLFKTCVEDREVLELSAFSITRKEMAKNEKHSNDQKSIYIDQ